MIRKSFVVPYYDGGFVDVFWEPDAAASVCVKNNCAIFAGNPSAIYAIAMQMLYYSCTCLPYGTHVHYDDFFCGEKWNGMEFILEVAEEPTEEIYVDEDKILLTLDLPAVKEPNIQPLLKADARACATISSDCVSVSANRSAYFQMVKQLFGMYYGHQKNAALQYSSDPCKGTWAGADFLWCLHENSLE